MALNMSTEMITAIGNFGTGPDVPSPPRGCILIMKKVTIIAFYDTILTFPQEVRYIYLGKLRGVTFLYLAARISMLLYQTLYPVWALTGLWEEISLQYQSFLTVETIAVRHFGRYEANYKENMVMNQNRNFTGSRLCDHAFTAASVLMLGDFIPLSMWFEHVRNIANGLTLLSDAAIFGVTVYHTWTLARTRWSLTEMISGKSLSSLILKQVQGIITDKLVQPGLAGLTTTIERPVSVILVLRFFLDLREQNAYQNGTFHTRDEEPCSSFKAAAGKFSNAIIEDLGDPEDEQFVGSQVTGSGSVLGRVLRPTASDAANKDSSAAVDFVDFPWVARILEDAKAPTGTDTG
ncbi:hypothetical protein BU17DRAFT_69231 [Hysterangium stoloniferum]|nr:hypothetical protein BU17DRAFT_69231 [Hysterangium stoloniferum]